VALKLNVIFFVAQSLFLKKIVFWELITYIIDFRSNLLWFYQSHYIIILPNSFKVKFSPYTS
jgi:hypothetical protein